MCCLDRPKSTIDVIVVTGVSAATVTRVMFSAASVASISTIELQAMKLR